MRPEGIDNIFYCKFRDVSLLLFQNLLSLGGGEEVDIAGHCNFLRHEGSVEYLALQFEVQIVPDIHQERVPLTLVLSADLLPVIFVQNLQQFQVDDEGDLAAVVVGIFLDQLLLKFGQISLVEFLQLLGSKGQVEEQFLLVLEAVAVDLGVVD